MRPKSLNLVLSAARINPGAPVSTVAREGGEYAEALIDVYAGDAFAWTAEGWEDLLEEIDNDPRTLAQFVDCPAVRALIRKQGAGHAAP